MSRINNNIFRGSESGVNIGALEKNAPRLFLISPSRKYFTSISEAVWMASHALETN